MNKQYYRSHASCCAVTANIIFVWTNEWWEIDAEEQY